ncbi:MAG: hypothetical protein D8M59_14710 [Planctomycetes bacterium]|nr:hypothetical protein [Planctomycetota bacterium]NOG53359.1 hypothetical protein [Planctomycetota bacterium]
MTNDRGVPILEERTLPELAELKVGMAITTHMTNLLALNTTIYGELGRSDSCISAEDEVSCAAE